MIMFGNLQQYTEVSELANLQLGAISMPICEKKDFIWPQIFNKWLNTGTGTQVGGQVGRLD